MLDGFSGPWTSPDYTVDQSVLNVVAKDPAQRTVWPLLRFGRECWFPEHEHGPPFLDGSVSPGALPCSMLFGIVFTAAYTVCRRDRILVLLVGHGESRHLLLFGIGLLQLSFPSPERIQEPELCTYDHDIGHDSHRTLPLFLLTRRWQKVPRTQ